MQAIFDWFQWLFFDVSNARWDSSEFLILTRFLLFLIVFALIYASLMFASTVPKSPLTGQKRAIILISVVLALLAVIVVPSELLVTIMVSYGGMFSAVLILIPLLAAGYVLWYEDSPLKDVKGAAGLKALICIILFYTYGAYANTAFVLREGAEADKVFAYIADFAGIASVVFLFLFFYYLFDMFGEGGAPQKSGSWGGFKRFFWGSDAVKIVEHVGTRLVALEFAVKSEDLDATRKVASEGPTVMANLDKALKGLVAEIESLDAAKIPAALAGLEKKVEDKTDDVVGAWQDVLSDVLGKAPLPTAAPAVIIKFWTDTKAKVKTLRDEFKELRAHVRAAEKLIESIQ